MRLQMAKTGLVLAISMAAAACASAPAPTSITLQELEPGICTQVLFETRNGGFTGAGYINTPNDLAARVDWSVISPLGGSHTLEIRFANGAAAARSGQVFVNGAENGLDAEMPPTDAWTNWQTVSVTVDLVAGENTISLRPITNGGLASIDALTVTGPGPTPGNCGEPVQASGPPADYDYLNAEPVGWVTENGGVTGGGAAAPVVATSMEELQALAAGDEPRVIHVEGQLEGLLTVGSHKTIIGRHGAEIRGSDGVLRLTGSRNVIIKNLRLVAAHRSGATNTLLHDVENVWLDHNTIINGNPDLVSVTGTSDYVTLSWNVFRHTLHAHDHMGVNIGARDSDVQSAGRLRTTLHHNFFAALINERMPRVRFGRVHTFNNLALAGDDVLTRAYYAVRAGNEANVRSERNIYRGFMGPSWWWTSEKLGAENSTVFNYARGNENSVLETIGDVCVPECVVGPIAIREHEGVTGEAGFYGNGTAFTPPYAYEAETPDAALEARIRARAGAR